MLCELLTTRHPFAGGSRFQTVQAIVSDDRPPLRSLRPALPATLIRQVERMLAPGPADRPQTAASALTELRAAFPERDGAGLLAEAVCAASS